MVSLITSMCLPVIYAVLLQSSPPAIFKIHDIIQNHALWLRTNGADGVKADLRWVSLEGADGQRGEFLIGRTVLVGVDLRQADFRDAKLRNIDFTDADLADTRFDQANLRWATLANTNLRRANF